MRLHYPVEGEDYGDCVSHRWVDRMLPTEVEPLTFSMQALLAGPTPVEKKQGFVSPFGPGPIAGTPAPPMAPSFRGVRLSNGVAIVSFSDAAMARLNSVACAQSVVKSAIERTLEQFHEVREVVYEVDGVIVQDWDA